MINSSLIIKLSLGEGGRGGGEFVVGLGGKDGGKDVYGRMGGEVCVGYVLSMC